MNLNLRHLEVFRRVAEAGSIRAAARDATLTQPALTYVIRELERSVGSPLFIRSAKGVVPTEIGQVLLRRSALVLDELRRTKEEIAQLREGGGHIRAAFSSLGAARLLPDALQAFRKRCPGVALEIDERTEVDASAAPYDLTVMSELEKVGNESSLEKEVLMQTPLTVIARAGHPLARERNLDKLANALWAIPAYGREALRQAGLEAPRDIVVCQSIQFSLSLTRQADALTIAGSTLMDNPTLWKGLVRLPLTRSLPRRLIVLRRLPWPRLTPVARVFVECLREVAAKQ